MPYTKYPLLVRIKLWLYYKLSSWYVNVFLDGANDEDWYKKERAFVESLAVKIYGDFGPRCKGFGYGCAVCGAYHAYDILVDIYCGDGEKPDIFNKCKDPIDDSVLPGDNK